MENLLSLFLIVELKEIIMASDKKAEMAMSNGQTALANAEL